MPKLIEKKEIDGRILELREFRDVSVVHALPKEGTSGAGRIEKLGTFKNVALAREFMSKLHFFSDTTLGTKDETDR